MQEARHAAFLIGLAAALALVAGPARAEAYFASPAAETEARAGLARQLDALEASRKTFTANATAMAATLAAFERIKTEATRHDAWLHLRCADDRSDSNACDGEDALDSLVDSRTAFIVSDVAALPPARIAALLKSPALKPYAPAIAEMRRQSGHDAGAAGEKVLAKLSPELGDWQDALYEQALSRAAFGTVATLDVARQRNVLAVHPDRAVRREAFEKRDAGFVRVRDDIAFALLHTASAGNAKAALRNFANAPDAKYFAMGFDPAKTRALVAKVSAAGALLKRFEAVRAADLQRALGIADVAPWDLRVPTMAVAPRSLSDARGVYHAVFAALGPAYQAQFDALLDPANARTDIALGVVSHRASGGFSVGAPGVTSMLFVGNFGGTDKDMSVVAHEGGHAVHRALMDAAKVRPIYGEGPHYLFESFAIFNELLLADYLSAHAATPEEKRYYDEQFLDVKGLDYIRGAQDAELEQAFYDAPLHTADDLDALTLKIDAQYTTWPQKTRWEAMSLAYEDPLYNVNYLYGGLLALQYYKLWKASPRTFAPAYVALLRNGFDDTPSSLLKRFLKVDLDDEAALVADARGVVDEKLTVLEGSLH